MAKKYFNGAHCNQDWQQLESKEAKSMRGRGWITFRKLILSERGLLCQSCRLPFVKSKLELHHIKKLSTHRQLRFERSNVFVCCQECHSTLENMEDVAELLSAIAETNDSGLLRKEATSSTLLSQGNGLTARRFSA
jgi:hypothetical protein